MIVTGGYEDEPKCGRPLGIRRIEGEEFIVADAYLGVFRINFESGQLYDHLNEKRSCQ